MAGDEKASNAMTSRLERMFQYACESSLRLSESSPIWIDVGAYLGTETIQSAKENSALQVYAFEPNLRLAAQYWGALQNFTVIPVAIAETDGFSDFYINANTGASSLLPLNPSGLRRWIGGEVLKVESKVRVPTMRLDTFMKWMGISRVEYLKVDAQGTDLAVVRSAGERIKDIKKITLEVAITPISLYKGAATRADVIEFFECKGFNLVGVETQTHGQEENLTFISSNTK